MSSLTVRHRDRWYRVSIMITVLSMIAVTLAVVCAWYVVSTQLYTWVVVADGTPAVTPGVVAEQPQDQGGASLIQWQPVKQSELSNRNNLGGTFGIAGSLFSALSFTGLIVALFFQLRQIRQQRQEIANQEIGIELQKQSGEDLLLLEISMKFWEDAFYKLRLGGWELIKIVAPAINPNNHNPPTPQWSAALATPVLEAYTRLAAGGLVDRYTVRETIIQYLQCTNHPLASRIPAGPHVRSGRAYTELEDEIDIWLNGIAQVRHQFNLYATLWLKFQQHRSVPPEDFLGQQLEAWRTRLNDLILHLCAFATANDTVTNPHDNIFAYYRKKDQLRRTSMVDLLPARG